MQNWAISRKCLAPLELPVRREAAGVEVVEQVQARQFAERDALVEHRIGLAAEHLDRVTELDQCLGEVAGVDPLAADVRLAPVRQVGEAQRAVRHRRAGYRGCYQPVIGARTRNVGHFSDTGVRKVADDGRALRRTCRLVVSALPEAVAGEDAAPVPLPVPWPSPGQRWW